MTNPDNSFPEIGWFKERFQVLKISDKLLEFTCTMSANGFVPPHVHDDCDEEFTALEGSLMIKINNNVHHLEPPGKVVVPKGAVHSLKNPSKEEIRFKASMMPNNGISSLFEIMMFLQERYPEKNYSIFPAMYILKKLKLKDFSTPVGIHYYIESVGVGLAFLLAPVFGWQKLANDFSERNQI